MEYTRKTALETLIDSFKAYYNVLPAKDIEIAGTDKSYLPLEAVCEFYERSEKYVISRKAELWTANCEEFIYLFSVDNLTEELFRQCEMYALEDGMNRAHIGAGHMYTYITPIFLCDSCEPSAKKALKRCRHSKSFKLGFHGWMDFHVAMFNLADNSISSNKSGKCVVKVLNNVLYKKKGRKRK
ncbi:MAG: hypothetical protein ACI4E1_00445 [Lachnospira sp.]